MNQFLNELLAGFMENYRTIRAEFTTNSFKSDLDCNYAACAGLLCMSGKIISEFELKNARLILRDRTDAFSAFRSSAVEDYVCTHMFLSGQPEAKFARLQQIYGQISDLLKPQQSKFVSQFEVLSDMVSAPVLPNMVIAAVLLDDFCLPEQIPETAARCKRLLQDAQKKHPKAAGNWNIPFLTLAAASRKDDAALIKESERVCQILDNWPGRTEALMISHIYAIFDMPAEEKCERLKQLYETLANGGRKYPRDLQMPALAVLPLLNLAAKQIADDMLEIDALLKKEREYRGLLGISKGSRLMHAAVLASALYWAAPDRPDLFARIPAAVSAAVSAASGAVLWAYHLEKDT